MNTFAIVCLALTIILTMINIVTVYFWREKKSMLEERVDLLTRLDEARSEQVVACEKVIEAYKVLIQPMSDMLGNYAVEDEPINKGQAAALALAAERVMNGHTGDMLAVESRMPLEAY